MNDREKIIQLYKFIEKEMKQCNSFKEDYRNSDNETDINLFWQFNGQISAYANCYMRLKEMLKNDKSFEPSTPCCESTENLKKINPCLQSDLGMKLNKNWVT